MAGDQLCEDRIIASGALDAIPAAIARHHLGSKLMLVCDDATYVAAGQQVFVNLLANYKVKAHSLGRNVVADIEHADALIHDADEVSGILAVGAGTVNDVAKYAAAHLRIPYLCIPTAASMNGYTSATSSLEVGGMKQSLPALPPRAVVADLDVIAAAPKRLSRAGVGDTLCRTTTEADCLLSHYILGTPYPREDFAKMRTHEAYLIAQAPKLKEADHTFLTALMHALLDGGDSMARVGSSITASQGEHMIAHTLEMIYGGEVHALHGELIAVTTITMNELHNKMLFNPPLLKPLPRDEAYMHRFFGRSRAAYIALKYAPKVFTTEQCVEINARLERDWPQLKQELSDVVVQNSAIERAYVHANIPVRPKDIRLNEDRYNAAVTYAYLTRNRFTFLDIAAMMGKRA